MADPRPGATTTPNGVEFAIHSRHAERIELCLFDDAGEQELCRLPLEKGGDTLWHISVEGARAGTRYGYRAHGEWNPDQGLWFDPSKLLVDPYALELDRPFAYDPRLSEYGHDTAALVPKAIVTECRPVPLSPPRFSPGGLIYEANVRGLTKQHPDIPEAERGTIRALTHPAILAHLKALGVTAVELMPITAWIDERHLPPLGLSNAWGYNPVALMALDPRLCPGGVRELAETVAVLHDNGIGVILDLVFNHTGESNRFGPILSMRGIDNLSYYRHLPGEPGALVNDTGTGNTLACGKGMVCDLVIDTLRHFVAHAGVDGFRFDLAPVIGRGPDGFSTQSPIIRRILGDELLKDRVLIAEPWDIGPGGYQLGNFPEQFLEWNDRARDDFRMFWRGDDRKLGDLATALAGSSPIFGRNGATKTRSVNFIAAHDGFSLMDIVSYAHKHNEANGEENRDGHNENHSWNNGTEGETSDPHIRARRRADVKALLATLFMSRGAIMLTAGDEFGRTQNGNNNAYAQDNELTWLDWAHVDREILDHAVRLSEIRRRFAVFSDMSLMTDEDVAWLTPSGEPMTPHEWELPGNGRLVMVLKSFDRKTGKHCRLAIAFNRAHEQAALQLPGGSDGWEVLLGDGFTLPPRSASIFLDNP